MDKKTTILTRLGWFAGQNEDGDDIFTKDKAQAKRLSDKTARLVCLSRNHLGPQTFQD